MGKNYFVDAYIKSKSSSFTDVYITMSVFHIPYIKDGKINYKEKTIKPVCHIKPHIFINNGRQS